MLAAGEDVWDVAVMRAGFKTQMAKDVADWGCESAWCPGVESQHAWWAEGHVRRGRSGTGTGSSCLDDCHVLRPWR